MEHFVFLEWLLVLFGGWWKWVITANQNILHQRRTDRIRLFKSTSVICPMVQPRGPTVQHDLHETPTMLGVRCKSFGPPPIRSIEDLQP